MLTGNNGVLTKATEAKDETTQATAEEMVSLAIGSLQTKNLGDRSKITPEAIANQVMEDNDIENVTAEGIEFPTNIVFADDGIKVGVNLNFEVGAIGSYDGIYSEPGLEGKIAPEELFDYEIIDDGDLASTEMNSLPEKTVRITRIKPEYCSGGEYNIETGINYDDTNYEIRYDNDVITKESMLVVPYQIDGKYVNEGTEGEKYKVTEVNLSVAKENKVGTSLPNIETIIYPNTVKKVLTNSETNFISTGSKVKKVILPEELTELPGGFFDRSNNLVDIIIPEGVTELNANVFAECVSLRSIAIPEKVTTIGYGVFESCVLLQNITIPEEVTNIGSYAFRGCTALQSIKLSEKIQSIGSYAFRDCTALQSITLPEKLQSIGSDAFVNCTNLTSVTYKGITYTSESELVSALENNNVRIDDTFHSVFEGTGLSE